MKRSRPAGGAYNDSAWFAITPRKASRTIRFTGISPSSRSRAFPRAKWPSRRSSTTRGCSGCGKSTNCRRPGGCSLGRAHAVSARAGRHAPGRAWPWTDWYESLARSLPERPVAGLCGKPARHGGLVARRGPRAVRAFFRRSLSRPIQGYARRRRARTIIEQELADCFAACAAIRNSQLQPLEQMDPEQIAWLIRRRRPKPDGGRQPDWLRMLRALFCGIYTIDNMDFVLRDAYMSGYSARAFDLGGCCTTRFSRDAGLTIHVARARPRSSRSSRCGPNCFARSISIARCGLSTSRSRRSFRKRCSACSPAIRWNTSTPIERLPSPLSRRRGALGDRLRSRAARAGFAMGRHFVAGRGVENGLRADDQLPLGAAERTTIFSEPDLMEHRLRALLPLELRDIPLRVDVARHYHRPSAASRGRAELPAQSG